MLKSSFLTFVFSTFFSMVFSSMTFIIAAAFNNVSSSSASGIESYRSVAPTLILALFPFMYMVLNVSPVFILPSKPMQPMAPAYHSLLYFSFSSIHLTALRFGAPVTVTAHICVIKASRESYSSLSIPST